MYCPKCGLQNLDNAQICTACGTLLSPYSPEPREPEMARTSGIAIASLVLAIMSIFTCLLTALPAIILGIIGLVKINNSSGRLKGNGMAIAGIAVPVVAIPVIALLMGILMPALARTRQVAFRMVCGTNLSVLSKTIELYENDYNQFPTPEKWCDLLVENRKVKPNTFRCRGAKEGPSNFAFNINITKLKTPPPDGMVLLFEAQPGWNQVGGPEILTTDNHQGEGCNVSFVDGHVEFVSSGDIPDLKWKPD